MRPQRRMTHRNFVIDHHAAQPQKIKQITQQHSGHHHRQKHIPAEAVEVRHHDRRQPHRDGAAQAIASRRDEHPRRRRKHDLQLTCVQLHPDELRERPRHHGSCVLQRHIHATAEGLRHGDHRPHQQHRKPRRAQQPRPTEQQHEARRIHHGDQRQRRQLQQPVLVHGHNQQRLVADKHQQRRRGQQHKAPPGPVGLPADVAPVAHNQRGADERHGHPYGLQRIALPYPCQCLRRAVDGKQPCHGAHARNRCRGLRRNLKAGGKDRRPLFRAIHGTLGETVRATRHSGHSRWGDKGLVEAATSSWRRAELGTACAQWTRQTRRSPNPPESA
jgi:hypothetical protein